MTHVTESYVRVLNVRDFCEFTLVHDDIYVFFQFCDDPSDFSVVLLCSQSVKSSYEIPLKLIEISIETETDKDRGGERVLTHSCLFLEMLHRLGAWGSGSSGRSSKTEWA